MLFLKYNLSYLKQHVSPNIKNNPDSACFVKIRSDSGPYINL